MPASKKSTHISRVYQPISRPWAASNLTGQTFGMFSVVERLGRWRGKTHYRCICKCGNVREIESGALTGNRRVNCGCVRGTTKHGMASSSEYVAWLHIKSRCLNPKDKNYSNYGGRGISMFPAWVDDFSAFLAEIGPKPSPEHSIDREDNSKGYEPGNIRWTTVYVQANNRRTNLLITISGEERTLAEWSRLSGISTSTLKFRISKKWPEDRLLEPLWKSRRKKDETA